MFLFLVYLIDIHGVILIKVYSTGEKGTEQIPQFRPEHHYGRHTKVWAETEYFIVQTGFMTTNKTEKR